MKLVKKSQTHSFQNSATCKAIEYPTDDKDINGAIVELTGKYPADGRVMNTKCKEMAYIIKGSVKLTIEKEIVELNEGDLVLLEPNEKYCWDGEVTMFVPCSPAWYPEQHKVVK